MGKPETQLKEEFRRENLSNASLREGWFAISHRLVTSKELRRKAHGHWYRISSEYSQRPVYRLLRFSPNLSAGTTDRKAAIAIDWVGWIDLQNRSATELTSLTLTIEEVSPLGSVQAILFHPNPVERLCARVALLSLILGALSLVLAFASR